jgi:hypothetical protein
MKKTIVSILLGIALSAPVAYADTCPAVIVQGKLHCVLTGSFMSGGHEICTYTCGYEDR